jgi:pyridoxamine 5'-phosphate oxidase
MDFQDCIDFANKCRTVYFATADGDQPRVRPMALQFADEKGFCFQTESVKSLYRQIKANDKVELCFHSTEGGGLGSVMRVTGKAVFVDDLELKSKLLAERPFLKGLGIKSADDPLFVLVRVSKGEAFFWTIKNNMKESEIERIKFDCTA